LQKDEVLDDDVNEFVLNLKKPKKAKKSTVAVAPTEVDIPEATPEKKNPWEGTTRDYTYTELLGRVFTLIHERNPGLGSRHVSSYPPPQLSRVGTRKTMWSNFGKIAQCMHRQQQHVMNYVLSELGTEGSVDSNERLILKGRYLPKHVESILKKYIEAYVRCSMCRASETTLTRDSLTRLFFVECQTCKSRRSVETIKSGFHAISKQERRAARA
jgi:translation initiation factor 2 subunit 2